MTATKSVFVTLDTVAYREKPQNREIAAITRRLQASGPVEVSPEELGVAIANGQTWCGGCFEPSSHEWGRFVSQRLFAFDIDNDVVVRDANGKPMKDANGHILKRDLVRGEEGFLDPWDALARWRSLFGGDPLIMYPTFSFEQTVDLSEYPTKTKYRLVFDAGEAVTSEARSKDVLTKLLRAFPEADPSCTNANRLFFASRGKCVVFAKGGPLYVKRP